MYLLVSGKRADADLKYRKIIDVTVSIRIRRGARKLLGTFSSHNRLSRTPAGFDVDVERSRYGDFVANSSDPPLVG